MAKHRPETRNDADPNAMALEEAIERILSALTPVAGSEHVGLADAVGRVSVDDVVAPIDVPPFRASAMDGYAFRYSDILAPDFALQLSGRSLAGHPGEDRLAVGTCQRITTGARVPDEADTVVQQEDVQVLDASIRINELPPMGENVRSAGSDTPFGTNLITSGRLLRGADVAVCAAHGVHTLLVRRRIRIGMLSTGDELVEPNETRARGQIHDANRILLGAQLSRPSVDLTDLGIVADTPDALLERVRAAAGLDAIVSSGGVSVGDADHVRDVLGGEGRVQLWKIAMKPGRPLAFGHLTAGQAWFGLPGNPVSAAITSLKVLEPALARLAGHDFQSPPSLKARLTTSVSKRPGRVEFQRGVSSTNEDGEWIVESVGAQDSHRLQSIQRANCLIELPVESAGADEGDFVEVTPIAMWSQNFL